LLCQLTLYVIEDFGGGKCLKWAHDGAASIYGTSWSTNDAMTECLCTIIKGMTEKEKSQWVYDGRSKKARMLADWWDRHQEWDKKRETKEADEKAIVELKKAALAKLTPEEMKALGINVRSL
jgi:hypothetical protein